MALIGRANVGKSTLLNAALGHPLAITSPVPQTTRDTLLGVLHRGNTELRLLDTPGLHKPKTELGRVMNHHAREAARAGVTANAVCPGPTRTPLLDQMTAEGGERHVDALVRAIPMRRLGEPEDLAAAVAFFASDAAGWLTGQTIVLDGGISSNYL